MQATDLCFLQMTKATCWKVPSIFGEWNKNSFVEYIIFFAPDEDFYC